LNPEIQIRYQRKDFDLHREREREREREITMVAGTDARENEG